MAHEIQVVDGKAAFAYNSENGAPWHRLGTPVKGLRTAEEMLEASYTNYEVRLQPNYVVGIDGNLIEVPSSFSTLRESPFTGQTEVLGTVGGRYHITQNRELLDRALAIAGVSGGTAIIDTCGALFDGRRFFASLDLGSLIIDPLGVNDRISRNLLVYSGHDGSSQIVYANTDIRGVCNNTVTLGIASAQRVFKVKHTPNSGIRLNEAQAALGFSTAWSESFKIMAETMLAVPVTQDSLGRIIKHVWPLEADATDRIKGNHQDREDTIRTLFASPKNSLNYGSNGWAAWNSVVEYLDHYKGSDQKKRDEEAIDDASLGTRTKIKAQEAVLALA